MSWLLAEFSNDFKNLRQKKRKAPLPQCPPRSILDNILAMLIPFYSLLPVFCLFVLFCTFLSLTHLTLLLKDNSESLVLAAITPLFIIILFSVSFYSMPFPMMPPTILLIILSNWDSITLWQNIFTFSFLFSRVFWLHCLTLFHLCPATDRKNYSTMYKAIRRLMKNRVSGWAHTVWSLEPDVVCHICLIG